MARLAVLMTLLGPFVLASGAQADEVFLNQAAQQTMSATIAAPTVATPVNLSTFSPPAVRQNTSQITQIGRNNAATLAQYGDSNLSLLSQQGRGNTAIVTQSNRAR